jgi:EmrB/QacA subfamily drug resistance transporter
MFQAQTSQRSERRRWFALVVVCLAMLMNALDGTVVNVALPRIQESLNFSQAGLAWVIDAYMISFAGLLLMSGRLGDLIGRKKVFVAGLLVFTGASAVCGLADSSALLIAARFVQGIGAALSSSVILAIIATEFPDARERAKAMSAYIFVAVGGGSIGLLAGGALTQAIDWHWIFFINLPIGLIALLLGLWLVDENEGIGLGKGVDVLGSLLVTAGLMVGVYAVVKSTSYGWGSVHTLGALAISVALIACFILVEARVSNPIMPLRIFRVRGLASSSLVRGFMFIGMYGCFFIGTLYLEHVLHYSAMQTGLAFLPMTLVVAALSSGITARLVHRFGPRAVALPAIALATAGLALLSQAGAHTSYFPELVLSFLLMGAGMGAASVPLLTVAMADVPPRDAGLASGIVNVSMQVAGALGVAVLGTISTDRTKSLSTAGDPIVHALTGGYQLAFVIAAAMVLAGLIVAIFVMRTRQGEEQRIEVERRETAASPQVLAAETAGSPQVVAAELA